MPTAAELMQRRRDDERRQRWSKHRAQAMPVYRALGIDRHVQSLPPIFRDLLYKTRMRFEPKLTPDAARWPQAKQLYRDVRQHVAEKLIEAPGGAKISFNDLWNVLVPTHVILKKLQPHARDDEAVRPLLEIDVDAFCRAAGVKVINTCHVFALFHTRLDECICWLEVVQLEKGRELRVQVEMPRRRDFTVDGGARRPAFQVAGCLGDGLRWAEWSPEMLGLPAGGKPLPVFVQSHALHRLFDRLNPMNPSIANLAMIESILMAKEVRREKDGTLWVSCTTPHGPLGYFVGEVVQGAVLLRSFLFLTMQGTPEHRALSRRLKVQQRDLEYLRLDAFRTYLRSDLTEDPELMRIFEACGVKHLLEMRTHLYSQIGTLEQHADFMRKYLNLSDRRAAAAA